MNSVKTLVRAPALTRSGYGVHSRQIIFALLQNPLLDVYLESVPWGNCAFLSGDSDEITMLNHLSQKYEAAKAQGQDKDFELFFSVTIPQEFERRGRLNIGITAAAETDRCSIEWLQKCNEMDLIVVPSVHAQKNLAGSVYEGTHPETKQHQVLKLEKPCVVCPEGFDPKFFFPKKKPKSDRIGQKQFTADWNFLVVGQWGNGGFGEDRKNIANTIRYFIEAFAGRDDVGLVLKVNMGRSSQLDLHHVTERIKAIKGNYHNVKTPPIHLIHETLTDQEMADLYNHPQVKALLSLTAGEGFGLPLLEAAACGLPIVATNWSGHLDFLHTSKPLFSPVAYELKEIPDASVWEPILVKGSRWAVASEEDAKRRMKKIVSAYHLPKQWATELATHVAQKFDLPTVQKHFLSVVDQGIQSFAQQVNPVEQLTKQIDDPDAYNILYTMPMSAGDVLVSTPVIDGVIKSIKKEYAQQNKDTPIHLYFATAEPYKGILEGNPNVHKVIPWHEVMMNVPEMDLVFDLVLTPNHTTQFLFSNWVRGGHGRSLCEEFANHCQAEPGDYFIEHDDSIFDKIKEDTKGELDLEGEHTPYMTFHPGSGKDQWAARNYNDWLDVLSNLKKSYPGVEIVQVGGTDEPTFLSHAYDCRGKTTYQQLASLIEKSVLHLSIDTFSMHLAASQHTPVVAIFGSSHAGSTGPWYREPEKEAFLLLEAQNKMGCAKACYKHQCKVNAGSPCVNEIAAKEIVSACTKVLQQVAKIEPVKHEFETLFPTISAYTTCYNGMSMGYPFVESISSMLGFCDELVILDHSTDGTKDILKKMAEDDSRIQLHDATWNKENPTQDGDAKAMARSLCSSEFCWQFDLDEVVHEKDYEGIKWMTKRFPANVDLLHLPVVECWGDAEHATGRRHPWKWRLSRNKPHITHGVNVHARLTNERGKVYAKEGMSDSCEYIDCNTFEPIAHTGFYSAEFEHARTQNTDQFEQAMNAVIAQIPSIWHYSWADLHLKQKQFEENWNRQWNVLYQKNLPPRFPKGADKKAIVDKLYEQGGEDCDEVKYKYRLQHKHPAIMQDWLEEHGLTARKKKTA